MKPIRRPGAIRKIAWDKLTPEDDDEDEDENDSKMMSRIVLVLVVVLRPRLDDGFAVKQQGTRAVAMLSSSFEHSKVTMIIAVTSNGRHFGFTSEAFNAW